MKRIALLTLICCQYGYTQPSEPDPIPNALNEFSLDICYELSAYSDHLTSPFSISTALGMTYLGASGQTKTEMKKVLHYPTDRLFSNGFQYLTRELKNPKPPTTLGIANMVWMGQGRVNLTPTYKQDVSNVFNSGLISLDFGDQNGSTKTINDWVSDKTHTRIPELLSPDFITQDMVLILTNAVYFKSNWAKRFDPKATQQGYFTNDKGKKITVDYMSNKGNFAGLEVDEFQMIELPYQGEEYSFIVILPKTTISDLENLLTLENFNKWTIVSVPSGIRNHPDSKIQNVF